MTIIKICFIHPRHNTCDICTDVYTHVHTHASLAVISWQNLSHLSRCYFTDLQCSWNIKTCLEKMRKILASIQNTWNVWGLCLSTTDYCARQSRELLPWVATAYPNLCLLRVRHPALIFSTKENTIDDCSFYSQSDLPCSETNLP